MKATIDTLFKTLLVHGEATQDEIKVFALAHDLEGYEVKREWPYDQPNCEAILKVMRDSVTYERVEKDGKVGHKFHYNCIMPNIL